MSLKTIRAEEFEKRVQKGRVFAYNKLEISSNIVIAPIEKVAVCL
jgi:hypothetical protein